MARSPQFTGDGEQQKRFCGWSLEVREGEAEPEGLGRGGVEWLSMQSWVCEPRTSPAGWLAHEAGPGAASHVAPSQRLPWEQMVEPTPPLPTPREPLLHGYASPGLCLDTDQGRGKAKHFLSRQQFSAVPFGT